MSRRRVAALLLAALTLAAVTPAGAAGSEALTPPNLSAADPEVAAQLTEAYEAVSALAAEPGVPAPNLAQAYGYLGQLLMVYDLAASARLALIEAAQRAPDDLRWIYYRGVTEQQLSLLEEAEASFERAREIDPRNLPVLLRLGSVRLERGRLEEARESFEAALEIDPGSAAAHHGMGRLAFLAGDWEEAARRFEAVLEQQGEAATAHYQLGLTYRELGRLEEARTHLARAGRGEVRFADPLLERLAPLAKGAAIRVVQATHARARGDLEGAIAGFRAALETDPELESARLALASALGDAGRPEEAMAELDEVLRRNPGSAAALYNLGTLLARRGEVERAIELLRDATRSAPRFTDAWVNLGGQLASLGRFQAAEEALAQAVTLDPSDHAARLMHAESLARLSRWEPALDEIERVARADSGNRGAAEARISLLLRSARAAGAEGSFETAAVRYARVLELDPDLREARYGRTVALLLEGDYRQALGHLEVSVARLPEDLELLTALARLLAACPDPEIRDGERALTLARRVVERELRIEHAETVAMALAELGRFDEAAAIHERVLGQARRIGDAIAVARLERGLEEYRAGRPLREPWRQ